VFGLAQRIEQAAQIIMVNFVHDGEQASDLSWRKAGAREPAR